MLSVKTEKRIFIIVFIICFLWVGSYATWYKYNELPINKDLTPEQVIEQKFPKGADRNFKYKYEIVDEFLLVCTETLKGRCSFDFAFRNRNSGFMFEAPGLTFWWPYKSETGMTGPSETGMFYTVYKVKSKYIIEISDLGSFRIYEKSIDLIKTDIDVFYNNNRLAPLTFEDTSDQYWVTVVDNPEEAEEFYCIYQNEKTHIINGDEIKALFGEE